MFTRTSRLIAHLVSYQNAAVSHSTCVGSPECFVAAYSRLRNVWFVTKAFGHFAIEPRPFRWCCEVYLYLNGRHLVSPEEEREVKSQKAFQGRETNKSLRNILPTLANAYNYQPHRSVSEHSTGNDISQSLALFNPNP